MLHPSITRPQFSSTVRRHVGFGFAFSISVGRPAWTRLTLLGIDFFSLPDRIKVSAPLLPSPNPPTYSSAGTPNSDICVLFLHLRHSPRSSCVASSLAALAQLAVLLNLLSAPAHRLFSLHQHFMLHPAPFAKSTPRPLSQTHPSLFLRRPPTSQPTMTRSILSILPTSSTTNSSTQPPTST